MFFAGTFFVIAAYRCIFSRCAVISSGFSSILSSTSCLRSFVTRTPSSNSRLSISSGSGPCLK